MKILQKHISYNYVLLFNPNDITALNNKSLAYNNIGSYKEAIKWYVLY